jgi:hypothetical protein
MLGWDLLLALGGDTRRRVAIYCHESSLNICMEQRSRQCKAQWEMTEGKMENRS